MESERTRNLFVTSPAGGRSLSAMQLPFFLIRPPSGFGVLTTTGRKTGKTRRRCVRAIRDGGVVYIVPIKGDPAWAKNARANPEVRLRIRGGTYDGTARELRGADEEREAREAFTETVHPFDYPEFTMWRKGRPTPERIRRMLREWFEGGTTLVVELRPRVPAA